MLLSSSFDLFGHHQKERLCLPRIKIDTHREHTPFCLFSIITTTNTTLTLGCQYVKATREQFDMASHVRSFSYLRWSISRFESTMRTLTLRQTKMDEVNALKKNPIQSHSSNNYTSLSHFNGFHFMLYLGRRPSCSGRT